MYLPKLVWLQAGGTATERAASAIEWCVLCSGHCNELMMQQLHRPTVLQDVEPFNPTRSAICRIQKTVSLPSMNRGCHIVTRHIVREVQELQGFEVGMANLFIQHTSASLTINENASPDVPLDLNVSSQHATLNSRNVQQQPTLYCLWQCVDTLTVGYLRGRIKKG